MSWLWEALFGEPSTHFKTAMFMSIEDVDRQCPRGLNSSAPEWQWAPFDAVCLRTFFQRMNEHLRRYNPWEEMLYTCLYVLISFFAIVGNGVVILAVIRKKEMRTNRNVLIVNLAISNLMLAVTTIPFLWLPSIDFEFPYSKFFCKFANALPGSNIYCSSLTISFMAINRYYSVKRMNVSNGNRRCFRAILCSIGIWVISFILSIPLLVYYDTTMLYVFKDVMVYDAVRNTTQLRSYGWRQCRLAPGNTKDDASVDEQARAIQLAMSLLQVIFLYVEPIIILSIFNMKLTQFLKMNAKQINRQRNGGPPTPIIAHHRESYVLPARTTNYAIKESPVRKAEVRKSLSGGGGSIASPAERASERRRSRTTMLLMAMAGSYALLWFPFTLVSVLIDLNILYLDNSGAAIIERIDQSCKLISILSICVNPLLYGFLNTNFRNSFTDIFHTCFRCVPKARRGSLTRGSTYAAISTGGIDFRTPSFFESVQSACGSILARTRSSLDRMPTPPRSPDTPIFATIDAKIDADSKLLAVPSN